WYRYGPEADDVPPLVLLHAFPLDARMWASTISVLPEVPVLTLDAPGFGGSAPLEGGLEEAADAVTGTLAAAGVRRSVVAGLSMGGYTLLALAERHPGLLTGVGLLDTKASVDPPQGRANRLQMA